MLLLACVSPPLGQSPVFRQDTVLLYVVPYDNDLAHAAGPVLEGLRQATDTGRVEIAAQVDVPGEVIGRVSFREGMGLEEATALQDSGSEAALAAFLEWAEVRYQARRYAIVVLDHGGDLPRLARDDHPGQGEPTWLTVAALARQVQRFREAEAGEVEAVVLQVCGKATLETAWELRHAARSSLASPLPLGAPNSYYPRLAELPTEWSGRDLLAVLGGGDDATMYATWTCTDSEALEGLPGAVAAAPPVTSELLAGPLATTTWAYAGDVWTDAGALADLAGATQLRALLAGASCGMARSAAPPAALTDGFPDPADLTGLAVHVPAEAGLSTLHGQLSVYRDTGLGAWLAGLGAP